jgi:hypothetical protein
MLKVYSSGTVFATLGPIQFKSSSVGLYPGFHLWIGNLSIRSGLYDPTMLEVKC